MEGLTVMITAPAYFQIATSSCAPLPSDQKAHENHKIEEQNQAQWHLIFSAQRMEICDFLGFIHAIHANTSVPAALQSLVFGSCEESTA
jgi:hypothetical protein